MIIKTRALNVAEKTYVIDVVFGQFLGLHYRIEFIDRDETSPTGWSIELPNGKRLLVEDHFFDRQKDGLDYGKNDSRPGKISWAKNQFTPEDDIPVLYGDDKVFFDGSRGQLHCGIDIFASIFFMLTRWEEHVVKIRDEHGRFPDTESCAYRNGFYLRPVVDEYVELLWNMLLHIGIDQKRKQRRFEIIVEHDVDRIHYWLGTMNFLRVFKGALLVKRDLPGAWRDLKSFIFPKLKMTKDVFDTFGHLMAVSETCNLKSTFYFMAGEGDERYDNRYDVKSPRMKRFLSDILGRGHRIGYHPGYATYDDVRKWKAGYEALADASGVQVESSRQHYLRFDLPMTWQICEDNGLKYDSSMGYSGKDGFRCGTSHEFNVFNVLTRKRLELIERPLVVTDTALIHGDISPDEGERRIKGLAEKVRKYSGKFVFLWHNSSFNTPRWAPYSGIYEKVLRDVAGVR